MTASRRAICGKLAREWEGSPLIIIKNLSLAFGEKTILKNINWLVTEGSRIGLVGDNGVGKSTFLRILSGLFESDDGTVEYDRGATLGYLPQDLVELGSGKVIDFLRESAGLSSLQSALEEVAEKISSSAENSAGLKSALALHERLERDFSHKGGYEFDSTAKKVLGGLGFAAADSERPCTEFSGGWRMRIALASVLIQAPDILLLDEPTNHLDTESMEWLEGWLRDHRGIIIFVSHDRRFLEHMATEIADMTRGEITTYSMGYDKYLIEKEAARERLERAAQDQRERIEHTRRFIERFRYKSSKATQVQSRIKQLEKMEIFETDSADKTVKIVFPEAPRSGYDIVSAHGISKSYGNHEIFSNADIEIKRGERVALVGVNGAGKSTLMRILSGTEAPDSGSVKLGHNVKLAYFSQESAQNLDYSHTIWEEASRTGSTMTEAARRSLLGAFLFSGDDIKKPVSVLSGGEKSRLALFKLMLSDSNFLILDEPTNHLDMNSREIFQHALLQYGGTLLLVSHDRFFLDNLALRVLEIRDARMRSYPGNYSYFIERRAAAMTTTTVSLSEPETADLKEKRRLEASERNRLYRERKVFLDRIAPVEAEISKSEARRDEIDSLLCRPEALAETGRVQNLMIERGEIEETLASDYALWEELSGKLEKIK
ncbi:MAG: ABC-F family ATP-binding cassette domain-containing protein [Synergistaceae bacterium]|jgi:ATP-binding cassette subfamily F protein 3|nr:ABC-F family ATP-binding cassette domain-containing protein [Synergistaceae bacterium]